jgi:hypothetical protein
MMTRLDARRAHGALSTHEFARRPGRAPAAPRVRAAALAAALSTVAPIVAAGHALEASAPMERALSVANFQLLGGWRLRSDYASEGLALVKDAQGYVVEAIAGAHVYDHAVHVFDLRSAWGPGGDISSYPALSPLRTWTVEQLFPNWISGQNLRDVTVVATAGGYELAGLGRVFYNTAPRPTTQINVRELRDGGTTLGPTREIAVDLPEQEFSGFVKHADSRSDLAAIGAGAYDSGQGSVGGLSYAVQRSPGVWQRLLNPPSFGDITSPRLPRDADYSCPDGASWVCIPPAASTGVWSTERVAGGGVRIGRSVLFLPTLGYGDRTYARQSYTFGDPALDRASAYVFRHDRRGGTVSFDHHEPWPYAQPGQIVIGLAQGRVRGYSQPLVFVATASAWGEGSVPTAPVLQVFRVR